MKLYSFHKIATGYLKKRDRKIRKGRQEGGRTERRRQEREKEKKRKTKKNHGQKIIKYIYEVC